MQKLSRSLIALGGLVALSACGDDVSIAGPPVIPVAVVGVTVSPGSLSLRVGERATLGVSVATTGGAATTVTWVSSTPTVATVSATGEVAAVAAGNTTVRATSTADASKSGAAQISVSAAPVARVTSVTVAPSSATLSVGDKIQMAATVVADPGVARTVTWSSSASTVASVSTTGEVTAVANGSATISATSTVDPTVSGVSGITVRVAAAASVNIKSITQQVNSLLVPVDQNNVFGQIDVTLNVDPGDGVLTKVAVFIDGVEAASQTFGTSSLIATTTGALVAPSEIILSVNTAAFNSTTGATSYKNGNRKITAVVETRRGGSTSSTLAATVTQNLVFRNVSGFIGSLAASGNTANDLSGFNWRGGNLTVDALPVLYGDVVDPFNVPTVQTVNITFGQGCDTEVIVRTRTATLTGSKWTTTFLNTASTVTLGGAPDNVFRYEFNPAFCSGLLTRGEVPGVTAVVSDGSQLSTAAGGFLNSPYLAFAGNGVTPDARFAVRLDNRRPDRVASLFDGVWQNTNTTSPIVRTNNWLNDALVLNMSAGNTTSRTQVLTRATDFGVSRLADSEITYESRVGVDNTAADASAAVTSASGLAESSGTTAYSLRSLVKDKLGNTNNPSTTVGSGTRPFGVDRTSPILGLDVSGVLTVDSTVNVGPIVAPIFIPFVATDTASGGATPSGFFNLALNPLTSSLKRVEVSTGTALTRWWCPATGSFVSTGTGCTSWVTGQSYLGPLTTPIPVGALEGYYLAESNVTDQAGNQSTIVGQNALYDYTVPAVGGISYPAFLIGGSTVSFTSAANDNVDLGTGVMSLTYSLFAENFQWPDIPLGTFGSAVFSTASPLQLQTQFIRSIQIATGGTAPGAALSPPTAVYASVNDVAGNVSSVVPANGQGGSTSAIPVTSIPLTPNPSTIWSTIPFTWASTAPSAAVLIDRETGGANATTVTITARATGPTGTFANPFTSRVEFWVQAAGNTWRRIGISTSPSVTDNGVTRVWSFSISWNPEGAYTAPFGAATTTPVNIIAIGVNVAGDGLSTDVNANVSVVVP